MQRHPTNLRQAEEAAAPRQKFATPQDEIRHIKATDRTLAGFARILELIRDGDFYDIDQGNGAVHKNWLVSHDAYCCSCVGALLAWFFDTKTDADGDYYFPGGITALAAHLGMDLGQMIPAVNAARTAAGEPVADYSNPFNGRRWHADYAEVFKELARQHPGK